MQLLLSWSTPLRYSPNLEVRLSMDFMYAICIRAFSWAMVRCIGGKFGLLFILL